MIKENINDRVNRNILKCEFSHFNGIYSLTTEDIKDVNQLLTIDKAIENWFEQNK